MRRRNASSYRVWQRIATRRMPAFAADASTALTAASKAASSLAASFNTRTSSRVRLSASGAECQTAHASTLLPRSTSDVSPRPSSAVSRISRVKSIPDTRVPLSVRIASISASFSWAPLRDSSTGAGWPRVENLVGERDRHRAGDESESRVETDVLGRPRHRLEAKRRDAALDQPVGRRTHDRLPDARALAIRPHRERTHPSFDARQMRDVEPRDVAMLVAPDHRAVPRVEQRVAPHERVELRHADADQPVAMVW